MNTQIDFFLQVENGVDPITVVHVHWLDEVGLDNIVVNFCSLTHVLHVLTSVLIDHLFRGRINNVALDFAKLSRHVKPIFSPLIIVKELLCGHSLCATATTLLFNCGKKVTDLLLFKLSLFHDKDCLILGWIASEAS